MSEEYDNSDVAIASREDESVNAGDPVVRGQVATEGFDRHTAWVKLATPMREDEPEFRGPLEAQIALLVALGKARASFKKLTKDTTGQQGNQKYKYATFSAVEDATSETLAANEMGWTQTFTSGRDNTDVMLLTTTLAGHGAMMVVRQWWSTQTGCPNSDDGKPRNVKDLGGLQTYYRRYALQAILGIEGDRDEDQNPNPAGFRREPPPERGARRQPPRQQSKPRQEPPQEQPRSEPPGKQERPQQADPNNPVPMMTQDQQGKITRLYELWATDPSRSKLSEPETKKMFGQWVHQLTSLAPRDLTFGAANEVIEALEKETEQT